MEAIAVPRYVRQSRRRLAKRLRLLLMFAAVLIGAAWITIGSIVLFLLAGSSPLGCPPTMGCTADETGDCSSWRGFMQSTTIAGSCDGSR